jgi:hypothetical protein
MQYKERLGQVYGYRLAASGCDRQRILKKQFSRCSGDLSVCQIVRYYVPVEEENRKRGARKIKKNAKVSPSNLRERIITSNLL